MTYAPGSNVNVIKGKMLWTSIWPLFAASMVMTWGLIALGGKGAMGVGGLGAAVLGAILSAIFTSNPVYMVWDAVKMAIFPVIVFEIVVGFVFTYNPSFHQLKDLGYPEDAARSAAFVGWIIQSAIQVPVLIFAWAYVIVRKANRVVRNSMAQKETPPTVTPNELL